jgi:hypothetical protein
MTAVHQLEATLRSLKLGGMLDTLEVRLVQARAGELGHQEFPLILDDFGVRMFTDARADDRYELSHRGHQPLRARMPAPLSAPR